MAVKRVYHFCNAKYGIENLERQRLKVATIMDLNDPFEFSCNHQSDKAVRRTFKELKKTVSENLGLICFSAKFNNPVQWAHYAEKHQGLCLGFDVSESDLMQVKYRSSKIRLTDTDLNDPMAFKRWMEAYASTKFVHWRYEQEHRLFVDISNLNRSELIFQEINDRIKLRQVIVGSRSRITRQQVQDALRGFDHAVETFKVRPAFSTFNMVRNKDKTMWL
ncbi:DUF2971 domain-containing protein [Pseudomonas sp. BW13M1]|uniref:DUF2971 domain-containing protein n=1 Tax=Pseudomonas peradeniyensis TaxID=2745488 RepID=A0A923GC17_9PSED|nr:DUF2971 domain-containing protein [Pseudomonas peradeniyensis]MBV4507611.1 DUF2971 domain-containing protein [Pseudomonas peradeniyensis]